MTQEQYDVIVVGAGILGLSSGYYLKKNNPNKKVLIIDRNASVGSGNTGIANAMFRNAFTSIDNQILGESSVDFYISVQRQMGIDVGIELVGYLWLMSERQLAANEKNFRKMENNNIELRRYPKRDLEGAFPGLVTSVDHASREAELLGLENVDGGIFGVKCGRLDPDKLCRFYKEQFLNLGGKMALNTNVVKLLLETNPKLDIPGEPFIWQKTKISGVEVSGALAGEIHGKTIVLSTGAWMNELLAPRGIDGHVKSKKRQLFKVSVGDNPELKRLLYTKGFNDLGICPMLILPKSGVHFKGIRLVDEFWVSGDDEIDRPYIDVPDRDLSSYKAEADYYEKNLHPILKEYFPSFENVRPKNMWAGLYGCNTVDFFPFVLVDEGLILVGGDSGGGIIKGDSLGRIVDAAYRTGPDGEATLYGDKSYKVSKLGFTNRNLEREEWVL